MAPATLTAARGGRSEDEEAQPAQPAIDLEASHQENRAKMLAAMKEQEDRERAERKRRREAPEADMQAASQANRKFEATKQQEALVERLEVISSKFGYSGGDEFKQMAMADESHLEEKRELLVAKTKLIKEAEERARFEAEQAAVEASQAKAAAGFQDAIQRKQREAMEAELAKKRARPGVKLAVRRTTGAGAGAGDTAGACEDQAPAAAGAAEVPAGAPAAAGAAEPAPAGGGLGLGGYDSDGSSGSA